MPAKLFRRTIAGQGRPQAGGGGRLTLQLRQRRGQVRGKFGGGPQHEVEVAGVEAEARGEPRGQAPTQWCVLDHKPMPGELLSRSGLG